MAIELIRASNRRIDTVSAFSSTGVQTVHLRYNLRTIPSNNTFPNRFRVLATSSTTNITVPYFVFGNAQIAIGFYDGSNYRETSIATTHSIGVWNSLVGVWDFTTSTASLKCFLNGSQIGSTYTVARGTVFTSALTSIGGDGSAEAADMHAADYGFWNVELTAAEITSLARGFAPKKIRPRSLLRDVPLIRTAQDLEASTPVSLINSPLPSPHPRIYL